MGDLGPGDDNESGFFTKHRDDTIREQHIEIMALREALTKARGGRGASAKFKVGDIVQKISGYRFPGIVRYVMDKDDGSTGYVVAADHPDFKGMLHIFSEAQLIQRFPLPADPATNA